MSIWSVRRLDSPGDVSAPQLRAQTRSHKRFGMSVWSVRLRDPPKHRAIRIRVLWYNEELSSLSPWLSLCVARCARVVVAMARHSRHHHHHRRSHRGGAVALFIRVSILGAASAAVLAVYRNLRLLVLNWTPAPAQPQLENGRAGRLAELKVAKLFEGIPGVHVYQTLRIPDTGHRGHQEIDLVLLTKRDLFVVEVTDWSGIIQLNPDGSWSQIQENGLVKNHPNIVEKTKDHATVLESYIERRGVILPPGFVQPTVFLVNPACRPEQAITMQPEVLSADQWEHFLDQNLGRAGSGWMKNRKSEAVLSDSTEKQLQYILNSAPTWDRLELEGGKIVIGQFQEFLGRPGDMVILNYAKRSAVSHLAMTHRRGWLGNIFGPPKVQIVMTVRDYRKGNANWSSQPEPLMQTQVRPETEVVFQPGGSSKVQHFSLRDVVALSLSS